MKNWYIYIYIYIYFFFFFQFKVQKYVSQLELISKGDVVGAKNLDSISPSESSYPEDSDGSHVSCSSTVNSSARDNCSVHLKQQEWTSLQCIEAMSVMDNFLKLKHRDCKNCKAKSPQVTKPTFGWFHMVCFLIPLLENWITSWKLWKLKFYGS